MRIDVIHLCGLQQRGDARPGLAAAMASREKRIFSGDGLWPDRPLDGVGVDHDATVAQEALESKAPGWGIADRLGKYGYGFAGQAGQLLLPQIERRCDDGGGLFLARFHPRCGILAADGGLDLP